MKLGCFREISRRNAYGKASLEMTENFKIKEVMEKKEYICPKCNNKNYEVDEMRATGGAFAKIFDVQNKKFTIISCSQCGYTELYKRTTSTFGNVVDFFTN